MKVAIIGAGKTGGELLKLVPSDDLIGPFNSKNVLSVEKLKDSDVAIVFVPPAAALEVAEVLQEANIHAVWGTTGFDFRPKTLALLKEKNLKWVQGSNFALGMGLVRSLIKTCSMATNLMADIKFNMHEVHHVNKVDAPSGTALSWKEWLNQPVDITHDREGDVKGIHELTLTTNSEKISVRHESLNRSVFAEGAYWCAQKLLEHQNLVPSGLTKFEDFVDEHLKEIIWQKNN